MSVEHPTGRPTSEPVPRLSLIIAIAALIFLAGLLLAAPRATFLLHWEHSTADLRTALFSDRRKDVHPRIALVKITDASLPTTPIDRGFLAELVKAVDAAAPLAIGLDIFFRRPTVQNKDNALQAAMREAKARVVAAAWDERGMDDAGQQAYQAAFIAATGRRAGFLNLQLERDRIVRFAAEPAAGSRYQESFALMLARTAVAGARPRYGRIAWLQRVEPSNPLAWFVNLEGSSPFAEVSAADLLGPDGARHRDKLAGKIVLIGVDLKVSADNHRTPLAAWTGTETPGVAIHAQMVSQLIDGRRVSELGFGLRTIALLVVLALAGGLAGWRFRYRKYDFLSWGTAAAVLVGIDAIVFKFGNVILPFLMCMLAWFGGVTAGHHFGRVYDWFSRRKAGGT